MWPVTVSLRLSAVSGLGWVLLLAECLVRPRALLVLRLLLAVLRVS